MFALPVLDVVTNSVVCDLPGLPGKALSLWGPSVWGLLYTKAALCAHGAVVAACLAVGLYWFLAWRASLLCMLWWACSCQVMKRTQQAALHGHVWCLLQFDLLSVQDSMLHCFVFFQTSQLRFAGTVSNMCCHLLFE